MLIKQEVIGRIMCLYIYIFVKALIWPNSLVLNGLLFIESNIKRNKDFSHNDALVHSMVTIVCVC